jgi:hypothetical protein
MDKEEVFKKSILPVLESTCSIEEKEIGFYIKSIVENMYKYLKALRP